MAAALVLAGCQRAAPPSQFPDAPALLSRLRETQACSRGLVGEGKLDYFGSEGRIKGSLLFIMSSPDRVRLDVFSPFGATVQTLTSNGRDFALYDLRQKLFLQGPANACNLSRFTQVPMPPHGLVSLLRGEPPVLVHEPAQAALSWEGGRYVVRVASRHSAEQEIALSPRDEDYALPYAQQRVRLESVVVRQGGAVLYRAELADHAAAKTAPPRVDPDGIDPPLPASGPECQAELPRRLHLEVPSKDQDLVLAITQESHNPPLTDGAFQQRPPGGVRVRYSGCSD